MLSKPPHRRGFRFALLSICAASSAISLLSAFISLALIGRNVNQDMVADSDLSRNKSQKIARIDAEKDVDKARAGQAIVGDKVVLSGYRYQDAFPSDVIQDYSSSFENRKSQKGRVSISDQTHRVIGYFESGYVCNTIVRPQVCQPLNN